MLIMFLLMSVLSYFLVFFGVLRSMLKVLPVIILVGFVLYKAENSSKVTVPADQPSVVLAVTPPAPSEVELAEIRVAQKLGEQSKIDSLIIQRNMLQISPAAMIKQEPEVSTQQGSSRGTTDQF